MKTARESRAVRPCHEDAEEDGREVGWEVGREPDACEKAGTAPRSGTVFISDKLRSPGGGVFRSSSSSVLEVVGSVVVEGFGEGSVAGGVPGLITVLKCSNWSLIIAFSALVSRSSSRSR